MILGKSRDPEYELEKIGLKNIWRVIDIVLSMIVLSNTQFYGYSTTKDFLNALIVYKNNSAANFLIKYMQRNKLDKKLTIFNLMK